ncbi:DUF2314 domain-containing protein [Gemmata palustris]|nr:DUF2314 domain-containing protein [Gemmata palustris]
MQRAYETARATFRYFWREIAWERRRIIPALSLACVKMPFSDGAADPGTQDASQVEQMWVGEIDFDGRVVSGALLNSPNWLKTVQVGDAVRRPLNEITDWMYAINGDVYGAYTVNLMRSRMNSQERESHDGAWGLNFGDPQKIRVAPEPKKSGGLMKALFGGRGGATDPEHPMSAAMGPPLKDQLAKDPSMLHSKDDRGWTLLHHQALAGSLATVEILLECGADPNAATDDGTTPVQLAEALGWDKVVALLARKGAR